MNHERRGVWEWGTRPHVTHVILNWWLSLQHQLVSCSSSSTQAAEGCGPVWGGGKGDQRLVSVLPTCSLTRSLICPLVHSPLFPHAIFGCAQLGRWVDSPDTPLPQGGGGREGGWRLGSCPLVRHQVKETVQVACPHHPCCLELNVAAPLSWATGSSGPLLCHFPLPLPHWVWHPVQ